MTFEESVPFNPEEVARRYACRPGFRLADYTEVGLPVYRLTVQAYFLSRKQIPPVEEFVLKAIEGGLGSGEEIGGLLGIERLLIDDAMASLVQTDDVYLAAPPGCVSQVLSLTLKGKQTLREAKLVAPEERIISIDFDGLLRRPIPYQGWLLKPRDLKEAGVKEIPPFPQKRPETGDLKVKDVMAILRQSGGAVEFGRDLLGIKAIERRELYFQTALALVYKAKVGDDVQVAFAVDGRLSSEHEEAFARANGPKKLGILQSLAASTPSRSENGIAAKPGAAMPANEQELEAMKQAVAGAQSDLVEARQMIERAESEVDKRRAEVEVQAASDRLKKANSALSAVPVRGLDVHEHPPLLEQALLESTQRLLIISPWIRAKVVNRSFVGQLEKLLKKNVKVFIGYGLGEDDPQMSDSDQRAEQDLRKLAARYAHFAFVRLGDTHAKVLISDRRFIVTTSFNWLSFRGDPNRTFRDEQGMFVALPEFIDQRFDHLRRRLLGGGEASPDQPAEQSQQATPPPAAEHPVFHGYRLTTPLGIAGMSEAFIATRESDGQKVFLKRARINSGDKAALDREVSIYQRLLRLESPHVAQVLDYIRDDEEYVALVTEVANGGPLDSYVDQKGAGHGLPQEAKEIGLAVAEAVRGFHESDIVHRDLKPQNVLRFGTVWKLTDFGIAKNLSRPVTRRTFQQAGTRGYAPPEQFQGVAAHRSADIYSFGKLLVFLLTGKTDVDYVIDPKWATLIKRCIAANPEDRPSISVVIDELKGIQP